MWGNSSRERPGVSPLPPAYHHFTTSSTKKTGLGQKRSCFCLAAVGVSIQWLCVSGTACVKGIRVTHSHTHGTHPCRKSTLDSLAEQTQHFPIYQTAAGCSRSAGLSVGGAGSKGTETKARTRSGASSQANEAASKCSKADLWSSCSASGYRYAQRAGRH